ncbi:ABC transporter ATP-binding protein [Bdellovibrio sp. HCB288]|uniref:ABC transporter ATP-binding protein n=1 Tax=Bdellovibrio sp. HCB288 TaxID=3394355 RepID=UPI0039B69BD3
MSSSVEVKDLSVKFGEFYAVKNVSFAVSPGEIFGFLGANGAGKTTTIRVLCGLLVPSEGDAHVCGIDVRSKALDVKKIVGYMSQKFTLYDDMTVAENLSFTASLRKLDDAHFKAQKEKLLHFIKFQRSESTMVRDLPGGIKQQVSLVASVLHDPQVVFLDEPTAGVSPAFRQRFWSLIRELAAEGKTVFVTTHYMDEAEQCGRIALMKDGQLIALDSPLQLKKHSFPHKNPKHVSLEDVFIAQVEGGAS